MFNIWLDILFLISPVHTDTEVAECWTMMLLQISVSVNNPSMLNVCVRERVVESKSVLTKAFQHMGKKDNVSKERSFLS